MRKYYSYLLFSFILLSLKLAECNIENNTLIFVVEIFRHGARTTSWNKIVPPSNWSQYVQDELTPTGERQHYILGATLRERYITNQSFLSPNFQFDEMYIKSDNKTRTIRSAEAHMSGLYPQGTGSTLPIGLTLNYTFPPWNNLSTAQFSSLGNYAVPHAITKVPIHVSEDIFYEPFHWCNSNVTDVITKTQLNSSFMQEILKGFNQTLQILSQKFGINVTIDVAFELAGLLYCDYYQNIDFPITAPNSQLWQNITFLKALEYLYLQVGTPQYAQLFSTPLFQQIIEILDQKVNGTFEQLKYYGLSGHDGTLAPIQVGLNFSSIECIYEQFYGSGTSALNCQFYPTFASNILIELYQDQATKEYNIQILDNGKYMNLCEKNSTICSYQVKFFFCLVNKKYKGIENQTIVLGSKLFRNLQNQLNFLNL